MLFGAPVGRVGRTHARRLERKNGRADVPKLCGSEAKGVLETSGEGQHERDPCGQTTCMLARGTSAGRGKNAV